MATVIQIKRSSGAAAPTTGDLAEGELAYSQDQTNDGASAILYIESVDSGAAAQIHKVGGKYYTDTVDEFLTQAGASTAGILTLQEGTSNGSNKIQLKAPASLAADVAFVLPGADGTNGQILTTDGSGNLSFASPASSSFTIAGDTGSDTFNTGETLTFTGGTGIDTAITNNVVTTSIDSTVATLTGAQTLTNKTISGSSNTLSNIANASLTNSSITINGTGVSLGGSITLDTGDISESGNLYHTTERVQDVVGGQLVTNGVHTGISFSYDDAGDGAIDATVSLASFDTGDLTEGSNLYHTTERVQDVVGGQFVTNGVHTGISFSYDDAGDGAIDATVSLASFDTGDLTEGSNLYFTNARARSAISVTDSGGDGSLSYNSGTGVITYTGPSASEVRAHFSGGTGVSIAAGVISIGQAVATNSNVTFNDVTVDGNLTLGGNTIKSSGGTTALTVSGANVTVAGDLTVSGTTTTVSSTTLTVTDPLIALAKDNNATDALDIGFYGLYDTSGSQDLYAGLFRDASDGKFRLFKDLQSAPTTTVNTAGTGYSVATLVANVEGSLSGGTVSSLSSAIAVGDGGTGATTFTSNGILYGNGTSAVQATAAGTDGYFLYSNSGTPDWTNTIDGGTY